MKEPKQITLNELLKELDQYRTTAGSARKFTKEQITFIKKCRDNPRPISWRKIGELWERLGWGRISRTTLSDKYKTLE